MRVLHILTTSVPVLAGYTIRSREIVNHQQAGGLSPCVLTSERFGTGTGTDGEETIDGITYYRTGSSRSFALLRRAPMAGQYRELRNLKRRVLEVAAREKPQLVHAHSPSFTALAADGFCRRRGIPLVYEIRAFWEDAVVDRGAYREGGVRYRLMRALETYAARRARRVVVICEGLRSDLVARGIPREKIDRVANAVDHHTFRPRPRNEALVEKLGLRGRTVLGFIGSFFHFEGLTDLVRCMGPLRREHPEAVLLLVGAGQMDAQLRELVRKDNLTAHVLFTGRVPHHEILDYYALVDIFVYPRKRGRITELVTPLKPLEALAMEKAVLMSDVGGLRELDPREEAALFFPAGDREALVRQCLTLCSSPELRRTRGTRARQMVLRAWGWDRRVKEYEEVYRRASC